MGGPGGFGEQALIQSTSTVHRGGGRLKVGRRAVALLPDGNVAGRWEGTPGRAGRPEVIATRGQEARQVGASGIWTCRVLDHRFALVPARPWKKGLWGKARGEASDARRAGRLVGRRVTGEKAP